MSERIQGEHEARIAALEKIADEMAADLREVRDFVTAVKAKWALMSGILVAVGAFFGAVASFAADVAKDVIAKKAG